MITTLKILTTPYYVKHDREFEANPESIRADGKTMVATPLLGAMHIGFLAEMVGSGHNVVVIMNEVRIWIFDNHTPPTFHFTIGVKVTRFEMGQHIRELYSNGNKIKII